MTDHRAGLAQLTGARKRLALAVGGGAVVIAGIGFAGSYAAVVGLAREKGFGDFAEVFPIGIDAGIGVLLALDLLLSWIRIPFPLLRHIAWMLTAATIAFNAAAAWPDPIAVGMHATMPVLFVVIVEAVRHAVGRLADITADRHMDGVRIWRWALAPLPTMKLWRRMKLWELRSYEQAVGLEQDRLIYQTQLQARYGRRWRRKAPVEAVMPLRLAKLGVPLTQTATAGLAAAGIKFEWRPATDPAPAPPELPAFEAQAVAALEVVGRSVREYADTPSAVPSRPPGGEAEEVASLRALTPGRTAVLAEDTPKRTREEVTARVPEEVPEEVDTGLDDCTEEVPPPPPPTAPKDACSGAEEDLKATSSAEGQIDIAPQVDTAEVPPKKKTEEVLREARAEAQKWARSPEGIALREEVRKQLLALLHRGEEVSPADFATGHPNPRVTRKYVADQLKWARTRPA